MKIGDTVVCINDNFSMYPNISKDYTQLPKKGQPYIIREIDVNLNRILLEELSNPFSRMGMFFGERGFSISRFAKPKPDELMSRVDELLAEAIEEFDKVTIEEYELV